MIRPIIHCTLTTRFLLRACLVLAVLCGSAADAGELTFTFIGNESFHITDGETTLLTDFPYRSGSWGYHEYTDANVPPIKNGISLITHSHPDHWAKLEFEEMSVSIIGPPSMTERLDQARVIPFTLDKPMSFRDIRIDAVETPHKVSVQHYSYLVTWHGLRLYFPGDTESPADMLKQTRIDVLFITPWLIQSVQDAGANVDAKLLIGYHLFPNESAPPFQGCKTMKQGDSFTVPYPAESND